VAALREVREGRWQEPQWRPVSAWWHDGKRFEVGDLGYVLRGRGRTCRRLLADPVGRCGAARACRALEALWWAGLCAPSPCRVPRPYGYDSATGVVVRDFVTGRTWAEAVARGGDDGLAASRHAARWLDVLQRVPPPRFLRAEPYPYRLAERAGRLAAACGDPVAGRRLRTVAGEVAAELAAGAGDQPLVVSHGDFHPKNVIVGGGVVTVVDLDRLGLREPAADAGRALGQLVSMSVAATGSAGPGVTAGRAFARAYGERSRVPWHRVAPHTVATLIECMDYRIALGGGTWPGAPREWAAALGRLAHGAAA
jgi:aminoglycoside phosphotransferase (APT) family kinase protein